MAIKPISHSYATLAAIAVLAFITACVAHEAVGHGGMCVAVGSHITLLTSVYFHCANGGWITSAAGPFMNLVVGATFWAILRRGLPLRSVDWRLFMVFAMAFNLFWGTGQFILCAVTNTGDWAFALRDIGLQPNWLWRCLMGAFGVYLYYRFLQLVAFYLPSGTPLLVPYLVAGAVACLAVLFFDGPTLPAFGEAAKEGFGTGVSLLLLLAYRNSSRAESPSAVVFVNHSNGWLITSVLVTLAFFATLGRGFIFSGYP